MVQMVRCGHESWRRSQRDETPVSEVDAENILNSLGDSPSEQVPAWAGMIKDFIASVVVFLTPVKIKSSTNSKITKRKRRLPNKLIKPKR
ncbi:hypothetical protein KRR40_12995 [Niabella defluvii]|nr:hypothetical protein KRR40_12995 [Niabella sp. I65]